MGKCFLAAGFMALWMVTNIWAAAPLITSWSSTGGTVQNKSDNQDVMYQVAENDPLTFSVTVDQTVDYEWLVNKSASTSVNAATFNWTVPNEKGIWEIHLKCWNSGGEEAHKEWVVSTLSTAEAPEFFDYFTDGKWQGRTMTDPWGRALPEWAQNRSTGILLVDASKFVLITNGDSANSRLLVAPHGVKYGTWKAKIRYTAGFGIPVGEGNLGLAYRALVEGTIPVGSGMSGVGGSFGSDSQGHNHPGYCVKEAGTYHGYTVSPISNVGAWGVSDYFTFSDTLWKDLKMIRTPDGYFRIWKGTGKYGHNGYFTNTLMNTNKIHESGEAFDNTGYIGIMSRYQDAATDPQISATPAYWTEADCIEIYRDQFMSAQKVTYGDYVYTYQGNPAAPVYRQGILVDGFNVRLQDIADAIQDPSVFSYDSLSKTAVCYTDLCIRPGAEMVLDQECLKIQCNTDGEHQIVVKDGATLNLIRSTVTSNSEHYYQWILPSEYTTNMEYGALYSINFMGKLIASDSVIDHCGGLYFVGADTIRLTNTQLTNLVSIDYPAPLGGGTYKNWSEESGRAHSLSFRAHQPCSDFTLKNLKISGKEKITLRFLSMDPMLGEAIREIYEKPMPGGATLYDSVLENADIRVREGLIYYWGYAHPTTLNLVNTQFGSLTCESSKSWIVPKYYLDVKVQDQNGNPVSSAKVTVVNEVDGAFPPENLAEGKDWVAECGYNDSCYVATPAGANILTRKKPRYGYPLNETLTGNDGHTPLPSDKLRTLILTDYMKSQSSQTNFTYTITADLNGLIGRVSGVDPDVSWYRIDPNAPAQTLVVTLGRENDLRVVSEKDNIVYPNPYIRGKSQGEKITFGNLSSEARIRIYTLGGAKIASLEYPEKVVGGSVVWDIQSIADGIYLYTITSQGVVARRGKLSIIK